jgi:hypothetical protein
MSATAKIAVIGATGMLGLPVTAALVEAGFAVTALVRNPQAAKRVLPPEVALAHADVRDEESLRRGLAGNEALYLSLAVQPGERRSDFHTDRHSPKFHHKIRTLARLETEPACKVGNIRSVFGPPKQRHGIARQLLSSRRPGVALGLLDRAPAEDRHELVLSGAVFSSERGARLAQSMR